MSGSNLENNVLQKGKLLITILHDGGETKYVELIFGCIIKQMIKSLELIELILEYKKEHREILEVREFLANTIETMEKFMAEIKDKKKLSDNENHNSDGTLCFTGPRSTSV